MSMCRQIPAPIIHITYISGKDQTPRGPQWSRTLLDATTELRFALATCWTPFKTAGWYWVTHLFSAVPLRKDTSPTVRVFSLSR